MGCRRKTHGKDSEAQQLGYDGDIDEDVRAEAIRVNSGAADGDIVKVCLLGFNCPQYSSLSSPLGNKPSQPKLSKSEDAA